MCSCLFNFKSKELNSDMFITRMTCCYMSLMYGIGYKCRDNLQP